MSLVRVGPDAIRVGSFIDPNLRSYALPVAITADRLSVRTMREWSLSLEGKRHSANSRLNKETWVLLFALHDLEEIVSVSLQGHVIYLSKDVAASWESLDRDIKSILWELLELVYPEHYGDLNSEEEEEE